MRGRCGGDAGEMQGRCGGDIPRKISGADHWGDPMRAVITAVSFLTRLRPKSHTLVAGRGGGSGCKAAWSGCRPKSHTLATQKLHISPISSPYPPHISAISPVYLTLATPCSSSSTLADLRSRCSTGSVHWGDMREMWGRYGGDMTLP